MGWYPSVEPQRVQEKGDRQDGAGCHQILLDPGLNVRKTQTAAGWRRRLVTSDNVDIEFAAPFDQPVEEAWRKRQVAARFADENLCRILLPCDAQDPLDDVLVRGRHDLGTELSRKLDVARQAVPGGAGQAPGAFHVHADPRGVHRIGCATCPADECDGVRAGTDANHESLAGFPRSGDPLGLHQVPELMIDPFGDEPQRHLPQSGQVACTEEIPDGFL